MRLKLASLLFAAAFTVTAFAAPAPSPKPTPTPVLESTSKAIKEGQETYMIKLETDLKAATDKVTVLQEGIALFRQQRDKAASDLADTQAQLAVTAKALADLQAAQPTPTPTPTSTPEHSAPNK